MAKILVTGGLGVVGKPLVKELENRGNEVWVADLYHSEREKYFRCDIASLMQLQRIFENHSFDYVYNLAAEFGRQNGEDYYDRLWLSNAIGVKNILRCQEKYKFRLIHFSSSEVYGDYEGVMKEDVLMEHPIRQLNDYAITKWVSELQIMNSADRFASEIVRVRLFNTYGPGEIYSNYRSVVCLFCYRALMGIPYTVYLNHTRSSTFITDTVRTLANIHERFTPGRVYNIGGTEHHDIKCLSDMILDYVGKKDEQVTYIDEEAHNTMHKRVDISLAIKELDHDPKVALKEGIPKTIEWMKEFYKIG